MLTLSDDAAEVIRGLADAPGAEGVRISLDSNHSPMGSGAIYRIELAGAPTSHDEVVDAEGALVFLTPDAADALDDMRLDVEIDDEQVRFALIQRAAGG